MTHERRWFRGRTQRELGAAIRELREESGDSQAEFAARIGSSRATLSRMERGESVGTDTLLRVLNKLGHELAVVPRSTRIRIDHDDAAR